MGKTIGIVSLKGGVGKTTTVASLGAAMSNFGKKVLVIDGNLSSPNLGLHLNIVDPEKTLHHVLNQTSHAKDAIHKFSHESGTFDVLPASIFERIEVSPMKLRNKIRGLKRRYDVILLDSSPTLDEETLSVMVASDEIIVVTTSDHATLSTTLKAIKLAKQRGTPISGLIINKVHNKDFEISLKDIENALEVPILAVIPYDKDVLRALSFMEPYPMHKPNAEGSVEYKKLAAALTGEKYKQKRIRDLFRKIVPKRQEINRTIFYENVFRK